jgi:hypothetical protein
MPAFSSAGVHTSLRIGSGVIFWNNGQKMVFSISGEFPLLLQTVQHLW